MLTGAAMRSSRIKMLGVGFVAPVRSSAARAALDLGTTSKLKTGT